MELASSRTLPGHDASVSTRSASGPIDRTGDRGARSQASRQEVRRERRDVLPAIAQGRDEHGQDVQAEVQILAESPFFDQRRKVPVSGRDHADVDVMRPVAAHGANVAELKDPQELRLQAEGHVADLVEQQRAAVGLGEQPLARLDGAGERAARVSEDLALQQLLRDGGRVHGDERSIATRASRVDRARDELLAHAGLARDEHRGARSRDEVDGGLQRAHRRPAADELRMASIGGRTVERRALSLGVPAPVERPRDDLSAARPRRTA